MLLTRHVLDGIRRGDISLVFRRWKKPTVKAGGTLRTQIGVIGIEDVTRISERNISVSDARKAGYDAREPLVAALKNRDEGDLYRIRVKYIGADPRVALRSDAKLTTEDFEVIASRLARLDTSSRRGPWTRQTLDLISSHPATLAAELAEMIGHDKAWFKANVRKLKDLGLTESLKVGYRLSPRGKAFVSRAR